MSPRRPGNALGLDVRHTHRRVRPLTDSYAFLLHARWWVVLLLAAVVFLAVNAGFGALYQAFPGSVANSGGDFADSFFFSVQTFAAIGYGYMYAESLAGHLIVTGQAFVSLLCTALLTGIVFAKFARPKARVLFSEVVCVERRDGVPTLTFRIANERGNDVTEAAVRATVLLTHVTAEGHRMRRFQDLTLTRSSSPFFLMSWQVFHPIDEASPLFGLTADDLTREDLRLTISFSGMDGTFGQTVHTGHLYWPEDFRFGHRFVDVIEAGEDRVVRMDYDKFHLTVPQA